MRVFDFNRDLTDTRVVLRASLNVPVSAGEVGDTFRIHETLKTIEMLAERGARTVMLAHIGRDPETSLRSVWEELKKHTKRTIHFIPQVVGEEVDEAIQTLAAGEVLLLENVRSIPGEKENDPAVAKQLATYGEVFINDAFADSHRAHASIVGIPQYVPSFIGPQFIREYEHIMPARTPLSPSLAIVGGAKFETKVPLVRYLLDAYDHVYIAGALANDFFAAQGYAVGDSLVSGAQYAQEFLGHKKILLPSDVVVTNGKESRVCALTDVHTDERIIDVGPTSSADLAPYIDSAAFIVWNGPLGNVEAGFGDATKAVAQYIAKASGTSVVGGGDTAAAIRDLELFDQFSFVSTAGGAMLELVARGTLVGLEAVNQSGPMPL
ncbi:MAG: phosphoglycerate kinase [Patescibacteria group bacterium UBA2163]